MFCSNDLPALAAHHFPDTFAIRFETLKILPKPEPQKSGTSKKKG